MSHVVLAVDGVTVYDSAPVTAVTPIPPAAPNPFIEWKAEGLDLVQISMWKLGRGLTPAELAQAQAAGYATGPSQASAPAQSGIPLNGGYFQEDIQNNQSANSATYVMPAGTYRVDGTDGFPTQSSAVLHGYGAVIPGQTVLLTTDITTFVTATAIPGNPSSTSTRFGITFNRA